jgi:hypothetical protein
VLCELPIFLSSDSGYSISGTLDILDRLLSSSDAYSESDRVLPDDSDAYRTSIKVVIANIPGRLTPWGWEGPGALVYKEDKED